MKSNVRRINLKLFLFKIDSGRAIENFVRVISPHAALYHGRILITCASLLLLGFRGWWRGRGLSHVGHAQAWNLIMISICKRVTLQQLRKTKFSILCVNLMIFFYLASNLNTFFKKCNFLENFIWSFFWTRSNRW